MITWNVDPELIRIGPVAIRYYSLAFLIAFFFGERYCSKYLLEKGLNKDQISKLLNYSIIGTVIGARLGHCLFYEPGYYLTNPLEILYVWKGGLASHGGFIGVALAVWLFLRKVPSLNLMWLLDLVAAPALFGGGLIRLGNLMNSEILGRPTDGAFAFVFQRVDNIPRHPAQLYESIGYMAVAIIGMFLYKNYRETWQTGRFIGFILTFGFLHRFLVEFAKENQVAFESSMFWNMGQVLSIPLILIGIILLLYKKPKNQTV